MSCFRQYKSDIRDIGVLERGLAGAGLVAKRNSEIRTWGSNRKVDLAVSDDGGKTYSFGLVKDSAGNYEIQVEHDYVKARASGDQFAKRINSIYMAQLSLEAVAANEGMTVDGIVGLDGVYAKGTPVEIYVDVQDHLLG